MRYTYDTWSIELPEFWVGEETDECVLFYNEQNELGAFQVSSFFKEDEEAEIEDADLIEFIGGVEHKAVILPFVDGIYFQDEDLDEGFVTLNWCLRSGSELFFVSYSCDKADLEKEQSARDTIINSLRSLY